MKRTPLADRAMPSYTKCEERFNMISHIAGGAIAVAGMVLCIVRAAVHGNGWGVGSSIVFGVTMILMYSMSSIYHGLPEGMGKRVMQVLDHCAVYVVIAGTYTPVLLSAMRPIDPGAAWGLFFLVWGLTAVAVVLNAIDLTRYKALSMALYIGIGWAIVVRLPLLIQAIGRGGFSLILAGGLLYTAGACLYGAARVTRSMPSMFPLFVVAGSGCHILAVLLFAV